MVHALIAVLVSTVLTFCLAIGLVWATRRVIRAATRGTRSAITALSSGGVSLLWPQATDPEGKEVGPGRTKRRAFLDALASGGVSLLAAEPHGERKRSNRRRGSHSLPTASSH
jgi:hypothetical protein